jgi:1,6-anhydro-N-acetylmuramate kinase
MRQFRLFRNDRPNPADPGEAVSRVRRMRTRRHLIGFWFDTTRHQLQGTTLTSRGCGRWSEFHPGISATWSLEGAISQELFRLKEREQVGRLETETFGFDLAQWVAYKCQELIDRLGPLDDELLAVCFHDDGWRLLDFDRRPYFTPSVDASRLAELSGLSVISSLRHADVAAGGTGDPLDPLALWFLLADRSSRTAASSRVLLKLDAPAGLYYLPASDGLDAEHPLIGFRSMSLWNVLKGVVAPESDHQVCSVGIQAVQGNRLVDLDPTFLEWASHLRDHSTPDSGDEIRFQMESLINPLQENRADFARTAVEWLVAETQSMARKQRANHPPVDEVIVAGEEVEDGFLLQRLREQLPEAHVRTIHDWGWDWRTLNATLAGVLGFMHIDQQPASLPWLTQADVPRLHGVLSPGRPSAWRRLLTEMADYRPPPMKLREAV